MKKNDFEKKILKFRSDLDRRAESGWQEEKTSEYIMKNLGGDPCFFEKTALVYEVGEGVPLFFRAELDALATSSGPKHLCGHSAHMAALMGTYLYFKKHPPAGFHIYFVFQPAEEVFPSGAKFLTENFTKLNDCKAGFAFHVTPHIKSGEVRGSFLASGDYFEIKIQGRPKHVKDKNENPTLDAIMVGSTIAGEINGHKDSKFVANVGVFRGGDLPNRIAGEAILKGDVRAMEEKDRLDAKKYIEQICREEQKKNKKMKIECHYYKGYPVLHCNEKIMRNLRKVLPIKGERKSFGTEDFSLYPAPKVFLSIGTGETTELHSDNFYVSDKVVFDIFRSWIKIGDGLDVIMA